MSEGSPTSDKWYWSKRGSDERNGPVSDEKLKELAKEGDLEPDDLVWTEGMDDWEEASSVEGVKDFFESPPPLPEESVEESEAQDEAPPSLSESEEPEEDHSQKDNDIASDLEEKNTFHNSSGKDERYWYEKKRWLILFLSALLPIVLWKGYAYFSKEEKEKWFKNYIPLVAQSLWFFPVGWYGIYKNKSIPKKYSIPVILISPLFFFMILVTEMSHSLKNDANYYKNNKISILNGIQNSDNLREALSEAKKYTSALEYVGEKDDELESIIDSLEKEKKKKYIADILDEEGTKKSLEKAKEYKTSLKDLEKSNERLEGILDSLRMKRITEIEERLSRYEGAESFEERISMIESAEKMYEKLYNSDPKNTMVQITYHKEFLSAVSEYGGPEDVKDKSIELCDKRTYESVSSIGGADLQSADAERISEMTYEVNGFGKLRDRDMDGAGPMGGIRDRPVTCRVSWEDGQPEITYFDF